MNVPTFAAEKVVTHDLTWSAAWLQVMQQLLTELNNNFGNGYGLVPPGMTTAQLVLLAASSTPPQVGTIIYNTSTNAWKGWNGSSFVTFTVS